MLEIDSVEKLVLKVIQEKGYDEGFQKAMQIIREYPSSDLLIAKLAALLENTIFLVREEEPYRAKIQHLYERISKSENEEIRSEAIYKLCSRHIERGYSQS